MANELPSLADLQGTYGYDSPMAYRKARENQDLAMMFQQQNLAQEGNTTLKGQLENQQSAGMNPLLLEQQRQTNTGKDYANQEAEMVLGRNKAQYMNNLTLDQKNAILKMGQADLDILDQHGEQLSRSNDPQERQQGQQIRELSKAFADEKRKHEYSQELERLKGDYHLRGINAQGANALEVEKTGIAGGKYVRTPSAAGLSIMQKLPSLTPDKRVGLLKAALDAGISPDTTEPLTAIERTYLQSMHDQDVRTLDSKTASQGQGVTTTVTPDKKLELAPKVAPTVAAPKSNVNVTKSGTKFKVVTN